VAVWGVRCTNRSSGARKNFAVARTYPVLSVLMVRAVVDWVGSMRIGERAERALTGLNWSVASINKFGFISDAQHNLHNGYYILIFKTGLPISFPATVGPLVGMYGEGRTAAIRGRLFSGASNFTFGIKVVDSGALA
jgi:hypothetical protein